MSLIAEAPYFLQVFSDGTVIRTTHKTAPCSATSKDLAIDPSKPLTARLFLPSPAPASGPLPLLLYFHGGGFCIGTTTWLGYHHFLQNLSAAANAIILSLDYRLAPENKLPTAYNDAYAALQYLTSCAADPALAHVDLSRVFLAGDSAGANIAHNLAVELAGEKKIPKISIKGILAIHPYFGSEARTELEAAEGSASEVAMNDMFWRLSLPEGADRDFHGCNFERAEVAEWGLFPATAVFVAGLDFLRERGVMYADFLKKKGVKNVRLIEAEEEKHVFHAWNPISEAAVLLQYQINNFMQSF